MIDSMPRPRPPNLHREKTRHGKSVWYVRIGKGRRVRIPGEYGSPEFLAAYDDAISGRREPLRSSGPAEGSFAWALGLYRRSQAWAALSIATRRQREAIFRHIEKTHGASRLSAWKRGDIIAGRDKRSDHPNAARHFVQTLRGLFEWALEARLARVDPTVDVKLARPRTEGFAAWTDDDVAAFRLRWPLGTRERVAFEVLRATGLRRGDAVKVGRPHVRDGVIRINTEKTGERVAIAVTDELLEAIAAVPCGELTFIAGERGAPMRKESFGNWFREACTAAGVLKSAHGIRKAAATADAEAGLTDAELDAKFGWTGRKMAAHYTRAANASPFQLLRGQKRERLFPHLRGKVRARALKTQQNQRPKIVWWAGQDSNLQPDRYERPALTIELPARKGARGA
jgi:site-specific recombinase XerD